MRVTLIHNPKAGDGKRLDGDGLVALIRAAGHEVTYRSSKEEKWEEVLGGPADLVAVAGGDGTVGQVARRLVGRSTPAAVLPLGTANNVAKTLGLTDTPLEQLVAGWATARPVKFDAGVASGPWGSISFIEGLGIGLFAETMSRLDAENSPERARLGGGADDVTAVQEVLRERLHHCPAQRLTVVLDGRDLSGEYLMLEVMNIRYIGPNLHLAPEADPGDGFLDVVLLPDAHRDEFSEYLLRSLSGQPGPPSLIVHRGKNVQINWDRSTVHIDDEVWPGRGSTFAGSPTGFNVTASCHALAFLIPVQGEGGSRECGTSDH